MQSVPGNGRSSLGLLTGRMRQFFFRPAGLEIFSIFSWIFGQFLQKSRVKILCSA